MFIWRSSQWGFALFGWLQSGIAAADKLFLFPAFSCLIFSFVVLLIYSGCFFSFVFEKKIV